MLTSERYAEVPSLITKDIERLDEIVNRFGMSLEKYLYYGRSRLGNETDDTITAYYANPRAIINSGSDSDAHRNRI